MTDLATFLCHPETLTVGATNLEPITGEGWEVAVTGNGTAVAVAYAQHEAATSTWEVVCSEYEAEDALPDRRVGNVVDSLPPFGATEREVTRITICHGNAGTLLVGYYHRTTEGWHAFVTDIAQYCTEFRLFGASSWASGDTCYYGARLHSRAALVGDHFYAVLTTPSAHDSPPTIDVSQRAMLLVKVEMDEWASMVIPPSCEGRNDTIICATLGVGDSQSESVYEAALPNSLCAGTNYLWAVAGKSSTSGRAMRSGLGYRFSFTQPRPVDDGRELLMFGGTPHVLHKTESCEIGFAIPPRVVATEYSGGAPANSWCFTYQWSDSDGKLHESAPSPIFTDGANKSCIFKFEPPLTERRVVKIVPYRLDSGVFYQVPDLDDVWPGDLWIGGKPNHDWPNEPNTCAEWTDAGTSTINTHPILYTTGGRLQNTMPPAAQCGCSHNGRVFLGHFRWLYYSHELQDGYAPEFNDSMFIEINDGGDIVALASQGESLVIFKSDRVFLLYGDGPNRLGGGNDFSAPKCVANVGCTVSDSVVSTRYGVFFRGQGGIYQLSGSSVDSVGDAVSVQLETYPVVTSAVFVESKDQVRFSCVKETDPEDGVVLVLDLSEKSKSIMVAGKPKWTVFKFSETPGEWVYT